MFRLDDLDIAASKQLIHRHGDLTVFFARFIFGLRTVAGPLAGILGMEWKDFALFNLLGAALWVTTISFAGSLFASQFQNLLPYFEKGSWAIAAGLFTAG